MYSRFARHPAVLVALCAVQLGFGNVGLLLLSQNIASPALWPASGFGLAALVLFGPRAWPAIAAGAFLTHFSTTLEVIPAFSSGLAHAIEALIGAALVDRFAGGADVFRSSARIFRFVAIAMGAPALGAVVIAATLTFSAELGWLGFANLWMTSWLSHVAGTLAIAPLVLLWAHGGQPVRLAEFAEGTLLMAILVGVCLVVFAGRFPSDIKTYPLEFLCVPLFLWASFRCGRRGIATAIALMAAIAAWGTLHGVGPFIRETMNESFVLLQAYVAVMSVMGLVLAAVVADHKRAEAQLHELAITDSLTGLANYRRLLDVLRAEISRSRRTGRPFAVVFVDMNGLKTINDRYGHLTGSRALCRIAEVLRRSCRSIDTPARFGGDEFAIVLPETTSEGGAVVLSRVCAHVVADTDTPAISVSGGLAVFPRDGDSPTLLLRAADRALYEAKSAARAGTQTVLREA
jgi:diguanylate cyclase (GGDEF)-like protein